MRARRLNTTSIVAMFSTIFIATLLTVPSAHGTQSDGTSPGETILNEWIVVFDKSVDDPASVAEEHKAQYNVALKFVYTTAVRGYAGTIPSEHVDSIQDDPRVEFIQANQEVQISNHRVPIPSGEQVPTGIRRIQASFGGAHPPASAEVAIIDTGIDLSHPDLNAVHGKNCINPLASAGDDNGHGTHVAGTVAADLTGSGVVGVVPGTRVHAVKVLDASGGGTFASVICGIDWVTQFATAGANNIRVANMSLGGFLPGPRVCGADGDAMHLAICESTASGITYVVSAGNSNADLANFVPAGYPEALTVTAMSDSDGKTGGIGGPPSCRPWVGDDVPADFSNFAFVHDPTVVAAPGVCILSLAPGGGTAIKSGTSMAAPHVSGHVADCLSRLYCEGPPSAIIQQVRAYALEWNTVKPGYGFAGSPVTADGRYYGYLILGQDQFHSSTFASDPDE